MGMYDFLIVGLGNPGREFNGTRHNTGFLVLDKLALSLNVKFLRYQNRALLATGEYQDKKFILAKPQTFMNLSGQSVRGIVNFYKFALEHIIIVHDDVDLSLGEIRLRPGGGSAGQQGMESIKATLGTEEYPRLRIGIGRPQNHQNTADFVLQPFTNSELIIINDVTDQAVSALLLWASKGINEAMNRYNGPVHKTTP
jgi:peptidyl-tRNA hydrolase, PTH1 family